MEKRELWGNSTKDCINTYQVFIHLEGGCKEDEVRLFSSVPSDWTEDNGHKLKYRRFSSNIKKHIFTVRATEHCHRFPREIWNLRPWRYSKVTRTQSLVIRCGVPLLGQRGWSRWPPEVPSKRSPSVILWPLWLMYHWRVSETLSRVWKKNISGKKRGC